MQASGWAWTKVEISSMTPFILQWKQYCMFPRHTDTMLDTCARLQNVSMNRRHSRTLILNIAENHLCATVAFSNLSHLHITNFYIGSFPFMYWGREGCPHWYARLCKSLCHFEMKGLLKWFTGLGFTSSTISLSHNPSDLWGDFNSEATPVFSTVCWLPHCNWANEKLGLFRRT